MNKTEMDLIFFHPPTCIETHSQDQILIINFIWSQIKLRYLLYKNFKHSFPNFKERQSITLQFFTVAILLHVINSLQ